MRLTRQSDRNAIDWSTDHACVQLDELCSIGDRITRVTNGHRLRAVYDARRPHKTNTIAASNGPLSVVPRWHSSGKGFVAVSVCRAFIGGINKRYQRSSAVLATALDKVKGLHSSGLVTSVYRKRLYCLVLEAM